jgi:hypothetical protein
METLRMTSGLIEGFGRYLGIAGRGDATKHKGSVQVDSPEHCPCFPRRSFGSAIQELLSPEQKFVFTGGRANHF